MYANNEQERPHDDQLQPWVLSSHGNLLLVDTVGAWLNVSSRWRWRKMAAQNHQPASDEVQERLQALTEENVSKMY